MSITLLIREKQWRTSRGLGTRLKRVACEALLQGGAGAEMGATILLTADRQLRALNLSFRGKDASTNVLSFPAAAGPQNYLGNVAIAYGVSAREAKAAGKKLVDHASHLAVHGILHLLGFDHLTARQAKVMEALETKVLASLKIADPYRPKTGRVS